MLCLLFALFTVLSSIVFIYFFFNFSVEITKSFLNYNLTEKLKKNTIDENDEKIKKRSKNLKSLRKKNKLKKNYISHTCNKLPTKPNISSAVFLKSPFSKKSKLA